MITQLEVKNFRCFTDATLDLERLTVLVGPNGAGKSSLVDALKFLRDALLGGLPAALAPRGGIDAVRYRGDAADGEEVSLRVTFTLGELTGNYSFTLGGERGGNYHVKEESGSVAREGRDPIWYTRKPGEVPPTALMLRFYASGEPDLRQAYEFLTNLSFYNISPDALRPLQSPTNPAPLEDDGNNLYGVLQDLKQTYPRDAAALEAALARILGDVQGYQVYPAGGYLITELNHSDPQASSTSTFPLKLESDGTLRVLGILAACYQRPPRPLLVLEEPELTVHPDALSRLWEEIQTASEHSQVILTTHSPDLLDMCTAEQLRVVEKTPGTSRVGPVDAEQQQIIKKRLLSAGQLFRGQGLYRDEG